MDIKPAPMYGADQALLGTKHTPLTSSTPLRHLTVIEIGTAPALASAGIPLFKPLETVEFSCAGRLLVTLGCTVLYVEEPAPPVWAQQRSFERHLRHGKRCISPEEAAATSNAVFLTDRQGEVLPGGLPSGAVVVRLSGSPTADWYVSSGMASLLRGSDPNDMGA